MLKSSDTREQIYRYVEQLSQELLAVVLDFLSYLVGRDNSDATEELLVMPGFVEENPYGKASDGVV
jgi:hypothetical protein